MVVEITHRDNGSVAIRGLRSENALRVLDAELEQTPIRYLTVRDSDLRYWPRGMFRLGNLIGIRLDSVEFDRIPEEFLRIRTLRFFSILRSPDFSGGDSGFRYTGLTSLTISRCNLDEIPKFISGMLSLTHLRLSYNNISEIPEFIEGLPGLRDLDLRHNRISELPAFLSATGTLRQETISTGSKSLRGLRVLGNPLLEPFATALLRGPEELFLAIEGATTPPNQVPPQGLAPLSARIEGNALVRQWAPLTEKSAARVDRLASLSKLLLQECESLRARIGNQSPGLARALQSYTQALQNYPDEFDPIVLGYWGNVVSKLSIKAAEEFLAEEDGLFDAFRLNHFLFVGQFEEWSEFVDNANRSLLSKEAVDASRSPTEAFIKNLENHPENVDQEIVLVLNNLKLAVYETALYDKETAYGLYKSIENVAIVLADALVRLGPNAAREFAADVLKSIRENAVVAVAGGVTSLFVLSAQQMAALSDTMPALFTWVPALLRYLGL